ncbi:MAG: hypothetical protein C4325_08260 [Blastocatellia bacterium]
MLKILVKTITMAKIGTKIPATRQIAERAIYNVANGVVNYAADAEPSWGNLLIVTHTLPNGTRVQSLYGHLSEILKASGEVKRRGQIGKIGNANGKYLRHLHF